MPRSAEWQAERDQLVAGLLAGMTGGLTEYELDRRLRDELGRPNQGLRYGSGTGRAALLRLEATGRARCVTEAYPCRGGFRRVWYPVEERS